MALEKRGQIIDAHDQAILCVAYNPQRREIFTGSQDNTIKVWQSETGDPVRTLQEHAGWVTGLAFATELRVLFSSSIDGRILVWSFKGELMQREKAGGKESSSEPGANRSSSGPLYCLAWDARRHHLVAGGNGHIWVYTTVAENVDLNSREKPIIKLHSIRDAHNTRGLNEPVRGIVATDSGKLFSVGYDRSLAIWDTDHAPSTAKIGENKKGKKKGAFGEELRQMGESSLKKTGGKENCHEGAISAVTYDNDNNWVITGSFDRTVKIWAGDGKQVNKIDGFSDTLTGLCYVPATRTLWMSANSAHPIIYDPRSATDITGYLHQTASTARQDKDAKERIQRLFRIPETGELLASTNTRALHIYKFNPCGACSILRAHTDWVEVLAYSYKRKVVEDLGESRTGVDRYGEGEEAEMVLVSAGADSLVRRWEPASRMNPALYQHTEGLAGHKGAVLCALYCARLDMFVTSGDDKTIRLWPQQDTGEQIISQTSSKSPPRGGEGGEDVATGSGEVLERRVREGESAPPTVLREHTDRVTGLVMLGGSNDHMLASVSWDLSLRLWDLTSESAGSAHVVENAHDDYILSVAYSPELEQLASASADQGAKLWDLTSMKSEDSSSSVESACCGVLRGHKADVSHVKWNSPRRLWVTGSEDHSVRLWNKDGQQVGEIHPPGDAITALAVDQRLGYIMVASMDKAMRVYSPTTQEIVQQHTGHSDAVRCIIHVPEKRQYITASWDQTIRVWRAYTKPDMCDISSPEGAEGAEGGVAPRDEAEAEEDGGGEEEPEEERTLTYAELHPLREPKWLSEHNKRGAADMLKKVSTEEGKAGRKKKQVDDDAAKSQSVLSQKLAELEHNLRNTYDRADKPSSTERRPGHGARVNVRQQSRVTTDRAGASNRSTAAGSVNKSVASSARSAASGR